jgi:parallel beta-helix repeat protein
MFLIASHRVRILHNSFRDNCDLGIFIGLKGFESSHNLIKGNRVSRNKGAGIVMEKSHRNQLLGNSVIRNDVGILFGPGSRNEITANRVSRGRDGIRVEKGQGNLVADNVVSYTSRVGIRLGISHPSLGGGRNLVQRNLVRGSRGDGFVVAKKDDHSLLKRNAAKGAGDDGFDVRSRTTKLTRNRAILNDDLGIAAVRGVIDGGGNIARHNGDARQCTHIGCS